jgi:glycosyltransferase involved in cell wall biosynthesis
VKGRLQLVAVDSRYRRKGHCCDPTDQYMRALVSILIPAYNAKEWVGAAIGSGLGQTWRQKEIIVVDHGSTDGTLAVARQFESNDGSGGNAAEPRGRRPPVFYQLVTRRIRTN